MITWSLIKAVSTIICILATLLGVPTAHEGCLQPYIVGLSRVESDTYWEVHGSFHVLKSMFWAGVTYTRPAREDTVGRVVGRAVHSH